MALAPSISQVANVAGIINATPIYVTVNTAANINTAISQLGNTFRLTVAGFNSVPGEKIGPVTYALRAGPGGNVLDPVVASVTGLRDVGDSSPLTAQFLLTVRSALITGNLINVAACAMGFNPRDTAYAAANVQVGLAATQNVILGVSVAGGDGFSNVVITNATVEQLA
jgi:hypothetical protein